MHHNMFRGFKVVQGAGIVAVHGRGWKPAVVCERGGRVALIAVHHDALLARPRSHNTHIPPPPVWPLSHSFWPSSPSSWPPHCPSLTRLLDHHTGASSDGRRHTSHPRQTPYKPLTHPSCHPTPHNKQHTASCRSHSHSTPPSWSRSTLVYLSHTIQSNGRVRDPHLSAAHTQSRRPLRLTRHTVWERVCAPHCRAQAHPHPPPAEH